MARWWGVSVAALATVLFVPAFARAQLGSEPTISLPTELVEPVFEGVQLIDDALDLGPDWTYEPDLPKTKVQPLARPISVKLPNQSRAIAFSSDAHAIAGVLEDNRQSDGKGKSIQRWLLHRYKLSTGQSANPLKLLSRTMEQGSLPSLRPDRERPQIRTASLLSIGTEGKTAIISTNDSGRLDAWSLAGGGKHLAAWRPYGQEDVFNQNVFWAAALSDETVLTLNYEGRLIRWKLPECQALYQRELGKLSSNGSWPGLGIFLSPGLSVNHRHVAVWSGKALLIIDAMSGKTLAILGGTEEPGWLQPTFHWDGTKLACTIAENFAQVLVIYDLKTGAELSRMPLPGDVWPRPGASDARQGGFTWVGEPYGVVGSTLLVNLAEGRPVWRFNVPPTNPFSLPLLAKAGPDFWAVISSRGFTLSSFQLPHAESLQFADDAPNVFAAGPGSTVSVKTKLSGPDDVNSALEKDVKTRLQELGMKVDKGQRVVLSVETETRKTGEQTIVATRRRGALVGGTKESVALTAMVLRVSWLVDGKVVWSQSRDFLPHGEVWDDVPGKSTEEELIDIQWQKMKSDARGLLERIPGYVMDPKAQAEFPSGPYPGLTTASAQPASREK